VSGLVLSLNAGSSNLKAALFEVLEGEPSEVGRTKIDRGDSAETTVAAALAWADRTAAGRALIGAGHRIVHGGPDFHSPLRLTPEIVRELEALIPLAPLHQPEGLAAVRALTAARPDLDQVACFDTAFHWSQPAVAQWIGLPRALHDKGVRRYGFHGLSYESIAASLARISPEAAAGRTVVAHLGSGASLCALVGGRSIATTMGFTPLSGIMMGTRAGELDPGVVLWMLEERGMSVADVRRTLYQESGLLGVSGFSNDMRTLLASDDPHAKEAVELFVYRILRELGSLQAAAGGLDAIVFTGGIGENAAEIRARVCREARWLGIELYDDANLRHGPRITTAASPVAGWVIPTDEEAVIARHTARVMR